MDPCSLTGSRKLSRWGEVSGAPTVSLDYCLQHLRMADGSLVQVATGQLGPADPGSGDDPVVPKGRWRVVRDAPVPGHCARRILLTDRVSLTVSVDLLDGEPGGGLCGVAETGAEQAIARLDQGGVRHRAFAEDSLALVDPCDVLGTEVVRQVPGLRRARAESSPSRHECRWGREEAGSPRVRMTHTAGAAPAVRHGTAVEERIAGRRTVLSIIGDDPRTPLCSAETAHLPFGEPGSHQREVAMLVVALPGANGIQACEYARGLAQRAWPRLPSPRGG